MAEQDNTKRQKRRAFLAGMAAGAAGAGVVGSGAYVAASKAKTLMTPKALEPGQAAQVGLSFADSRPANTERVKAKTGSPNVVAIILDDCGIADLGCYGSEIKTPAVDGLAKQGLQYTNFRTTAMCSPTRASFLTGLNHHSAGMGWLADIDAGYPGYRGDLTHEAATLAEVLRDAGWSTLLVGKWHVNNANTTGANGPYDNWPTQRGFDRAYWFQGHSTDYFKPSELFDGVAPVEPPDDPNYYVCDDLTDRAITYVRTQKALEPNKPFYLHLAYPGPHSPLQAKPQDRDAYKGQYDEGWDAIRAKRLERQKKMGLMPDTVELPPLSLGATEWSKVPAEHRKIMSRYMEVYAGLISNLDMNIGRLMTSLEEIGERDNTIVVLFSDNGGSPEGSPTGTPNVFAPAFGRPVPVEEAAKLYDVMGEEGTFPHYPMGWAACSNTPYRQYKQYTHLGGVADPLIVSWPKGISAQGEVRHNFVHVVDLFPTLLEATGVERPKTYKGQVQKPVEGQSVVPTFAKADAPTRTEQYFELGGNRAYQEGSWRLVARHTKGKDFEKDPWELFDLSKDPNELNDVASAHPDIVKRLMDKWLQAAQQYQVLPLDDRNFVIRLAQDRQQKSLREKWTFHPPVERLARDVAPIVCGFSHTVDVDCERLPGKGDGVLVAQGAKYAGWVLYIQNGKLVYEQSLIPWVERIEVADALPEGKLSIRYQQTMTARPFDGEGALFVNGKKMAQHTFKRVLFSTSYDGFTLGSDLGNQVSTRYKGPFPFQGRLGVVNIRVDISKSTPVEMLRFINAMGLNI
ncbi:arylsulfatase [Limnobacter humi]|uniref:Arylsulfatase n=1 Tax=Limnobacter humi TaxID=1778671 RepID=A0ABT1WFC1_9BURK|nr:arylsulfatase [Limnobacter humi]MCQ8896165.1 arylsulfatase [Limnobacter humi]